MITSHLNVEMVEIMLANYLFRFLRHWGYLASRNRIARYNGNNELSNEANKTFLRIAPWCFAQSIMETCAHIRTI